MEAVILAFSSTKGLNPDQKEGISCIFFPEAVWRIKDITKNKSDVTREVIVVADKFLGIKDVLPEAPYVSICTQEKLQVHRQPAARAKIGHMRSMCLWMRMKWIAKFIIMFYVLQCNARSLVASGQVLKRFVVAFVEKPYVYRRFGLSHV